MVTESDIIRLPFTTDLTEAGIHQAIRKSVSEIKPGSQSLFDRLQQEIFQMGVRLALRRYLAAENVPHSTIDIRPLSQPDQYDLTIGGRRCDIRIFPVTHKKSIQRWIHVPKKLISLPNYISKGELLKELESHNDILIFAFVTALLARRGHVLSKAMRAGQPVYLTSTLPPTWSHPIRWTSLGEMAIKSDGNRVIELELFGLNAAREFQFERVSLPPHQHKIVKHDFFTITHLHVDGLPDGRISIYSPARNATWVVAPLDWVNIWVYGMDIFFTGYLSRSKFIQHASPAPDDIQIPHLFKHPPDSLCVPVSDLLPLGGLFDQAKKWQSAGW